jgi:hypothetical protein
MEEFLWSRWLAAVVVLFGGGRRRCSGSACCRARCVSYFVGAGTRILESNGDWGDQHQPNEAHAHKSGDETKTSTSTLDGGKWKDITMLGYLV